MRLLLDTHILLWWLTDDPRLTTSHRRLITDDGNTAFVSSMTVVEISIKASLGKLDAPTEIVAELEAGGFDLLDFDGRHAEALRALPWHHRDPFDRMLVAQALVEDLLFLTVDERIPPYGVRTAITP